MDLYTVISPAAIDLTGEHLPDLGTDVVITDQTSLLGAEKTPLPAGGGLETGAQSCAPQPPAKE
jgi:hypothetical protein